MDGPEPARASRDGVSLGSAPAATARSESSIVRSSPQGELGVATAKGLPTPARTAGASRVVSVGPAWLRRNDNRWSCVPSGGRPPRPLSPQHRTEGDGRGDEDDDVTTVDGGFQLQSEEQRVELNRRIRSVLDNTLPFLGLRHRIRSSRHPRARLPASGGARRSTGRCCSACRRGRRVRRRPFRVCRRRCPIRRRPFRACRRRPHFVAVDFEFADAGARFVAAHFEFARPVPDSSPSISSLPAGTSPPSVVPGSSPPAIVRASFVRAVGLPKAPPPRRRRSGTLASPSSREPADDEAVEGELDHEAFRFDRRSNPGITLTSPRPPIDPARSGGRGRRG